MKIEYKSETVPESVEEISPASRSSGSNPKSSAASACPLIPFSIVAPLVLFNASYTIAIEPKAFGIAGSPASIFLLLHVRLFTFDPPTSSTTNYVSSTLTISSFVTTVAIPNAFAK